MTKLYELNAEHDFDVIVLDTPPSRNALDFLRAPENMLHFLEGRALKVFLAPGGLAARFLGRGTGLVFAIFARVTGVDMLGELSTFFRSLSGVIDGFGERIRGVAELLREGTTSFLIVTSPEPEPAREAVFLAEQLSEAGMARDGAIVNRVHLHGLDGHSVEEVAGAARARPGRVAGAAHGAQPRRLRRARTARPRDDRPSAPRARRAEPGDRAASGRGHPGPRGLGPDRRLPLRLTAAQTGSAL